MNWLERHVKEWLVQHLSTALGRPLNINVRPMSGDYHPEAAWLLAVIRQNHIKLHSETVEALKECNDNNAMSGMFGDRYTSSIVNRSKVCTAITVHSAIKASLRSANGIATRTGKAIILTGRDMWLHNVLAAKMGIKVVYDPRISRSVASDSMAYLDAIVSWGIPDLNRAILVDTGWNGTIWKRLHAITGDSPMNQMMSSETRGEWQQFRKLKCARDLAVKIEDTPKYWKSGEVVSGKVRQLPAGVNEIIKAAALTIWAWHCQSPNFMHPDNYVGKWTKKAMMLRNPTKNKLARAFRRLQRRLQRKQSNTTSIHGKRISCFAPVRRLRSVACMLCMSAECPACNTQLS